MRANTRRRERLDIGLYRRTTAAGDKPATDVEVARIAERSGDAN